MTRISRRRFLEDAMLATAAATGAGAVGQVLADEKQSPSANEKLSVAVIGVRGRGGAHARAFADRNDCEITYICDADREEGPKVMQNIGKLQGRTPKCVVDMREIFDDKSVDIVSIATPNHWHSLAAIWAMQAGKDVYVEKPVSHNISEGRRMVQVARKYKRICQGGTQYRSNASNKAAARYIKQGKLGQIKLARCLTYNRRNSIGPAGNYKVPPSVDYNLWAGPAPMSPVTRRSFHYDWHWFWDFGNGELGNNSVHPVDAMRLILDLEGLGRRVMSYGGRVGLNDAGETPSAQVTIHDFGNTTVVQEVRNLKTDKPRYGAGILIVGTEGYLASKLTSNSVFDPDGQLVEKLEGESEDHFANFVKAVRSRKLEDLNAEIVQGHVSTAVVHVGNISQQLGRVASAAEITAQLESLDVNENVLETFQQMREHLAANDVDIENTPLTLGPWLQIDSDKEAFVGNAAADAFLTRDYRAPFVVPAVDEI